MMGVLTEYARIVNSSYEEYNHKANTRPNHHSLSFPRYGVNLMILPTLPHNMPGLDCPE
jgi:hypothetical protein